MAFVKREDSDDISSRLETLESQIELIGERLEAWMLDQDRIELEREEYRQSLEGKIRELENQIGNIPNHAAEDADTTIWNTIASLLQSHKDTENFVESRV